MYFRIVTNIYSMDETPQDRSSPKPKKDVIHSLKLTAKAPENSPGPKRKQSYSNHPFSGAKMLVSGRVHPNNMVHPK